jgi:uncharacterized protein
MTIRHPVRVLAATAILWTAAVGMAAAQQQPQAQQPQAQQAPQRPAPSAAAMAMAKEIIDMKGATHTFDPLVNGVIEYHRNLMIQTNPNLSRAIEQVAAKMINDMQSRRLELQQSLARTYAQHFTEQELRDALAFYRTPLGKKLVTQEPKAMEETMMAADAWSRKFAEEVVEKLRAEMKKLGHNVI